MLRAAAEAYSATGNEMALFIAKAIEAAAFGPLSDSRLDHPVMQHLATALASPGAHPFCAAYAPEILALPWSRRFADRMSGAIRENYAAVVLAGSPGLATVEGISMGLFLQGPNVYYPAHWHAAEEFYLVLSGTAEWQQGDGPFRALAPGQTAHHASYEHHIMRTGDEPLLAMWSWRGDLDPDTYGIAES